MKECATADKGNDVHGVMKGMLSDRGPRGQGVALLENIPLNLNKGHKDPGQRRVRLRSGERKEHPLRGLKFTRLEEKWPERRATEDVLLWGPTKHKNKNQSSGARRVTAGRRALWRGCFDDVQRCSCLGERDPWRGPTPCSDAQLCPRQVMLLCVSSAEGTLGKPVSHPPRSP